MQATPTAWMATASATATALGATDVDLVRQYAVSLLLAILATALFTPVLLLLYRSRIGAWMGRSAGAAPPLAVPERAGAVALPPLPELLHRSRHGVRTRARAWLLGFGVQALLLALLFAARYSEQLSPGAWLLALGVLLLPAALILLSVSTASGWSRLLVVGLALLALSRWPGLTGELVRQVAELHVGLPLVPLVLFHLRFWRGAAPLVFLLALVGFHGWMLGLGLATGVLGIGAGAGLWLARLVGLAMGLAVGGWILRAVAARHARGSLSDQAFNLESWWLLYTLVQAFVATSGLGLGAGVVALLSFLLGRWVVELLLRRSTLPSREPHRLLLLRVFGNSRRSERLFEQLVQAWNPLGSIELIGGTDLALQHVAPLDFLAFLTGRLGERFGEAPGETAARLASAPNRAVDGSYAARQTFCPADGWEATMRQLLAASDAVVMDLRDFRAERTGCRLELEALARSGSRRPLVLVTDASTDLALLRNVLQAAGADPDQPPWRLVPAAPREAGTVGRVLAAIAGA